MYHWILLNMWIDAFLTRISSKFLSRTSFWQSYHSLPSYTWFEPILTPLWSCYLVWTILTNKFILIFVLRDDLKFCLKIISFSVILHVVWAYFDTIMILPSCLNNLNQQTHLNFPSKRWLEVLFDNIVILCHSTRGLSLFWHHYDPAILFEQF